MCCINSQHNITMAPTKLVLLLAFVALANCARMPDLQLVEADLPESVVAFQGGELQAPHSEEDNGLDLGE